MIRKEIYLSFLLCILLFASIDILLYNYIILGKEEDKDEDIENNSINELIDSDSNYNRDGRDEIIEKEDIENNVPFILPFNAVPFP